MWGVFRVHRGSVSRDALKNAQNILTKGGVLGIFPEGGSWADVLRPARPGAALLAVRTGAQILPVGLEGVTNVFPVRIGRRAKVNVRIGKPFGPFRESIKGREGRRRLEEIGDLIMKKVAELIPNERRGFYSDDPDVRAAARGTELYPWEDKLEK
jgi:1-acyl-sn-glycerol-3-phosphate acyltransferase